MKQEHFDVSRIIGLKVVGKRKSNYKWLYEKRKTAFFGLIKLNDYYPAGYYEYGCYETGCDSMGGSWDATAYSSYDLKNYGYLVEGFDQVYDKPYVTVYLESDYTSTQKFNSNEEALEWAEQLKASTGKSFAIVIHE